VGQQSQLLTFAVLYWYHLMVDSTMATVDGKVPRLKRRDPTGRERRRLIQALAQLDTSFGTYTLNGVKLG
jgi:hypothetical protein